MLVRMQWNNYTEFHRAKHLSFNAFLHVFSTTAETLMHIEESQSAKCFHFGPFVLAHNSAQKCNDSPDEFFFYLGPISGKF